MGAELLEEMAGKAVALCKRIIEEAGNEVVAGFVAQGEEGMITILAGWENDVERDMVLQNVRRLFKEKNVTCYIQYAEAWMAPGSESPLAMHPERQECLIISGNSTDGEKLFRSYPIEHLPDGQRRLGAPLEPHKPVAGAMLNLLEPDATLH